MSLETHSWPLVWASTQSHVKVCLIGSELFLTTGANRTCDPKVSSWRTAPSTKQTVHKLEETALRCGSRASHPLSISAVCTGQSLGGCVLKEAYTLNYVSLMKHSQHFSKEEKWQLMPFQTLNKAVWAPPKNHHQCRTLSNPPFIVLKAHDYELHLRYILGLESSQRKRLKI